MGQRGSSPGRLRRQMQPAGRTGELACRRIGAPRAQGRGMMEGESSGDDRGEGYFRP